MVLHAFELGCSRCRLAAGPPRTPLPNFVAGCSCCCLLACFTNLLPSWYPFRTPPTRTPSSLGLLPFRRRPSPAHSLETTLAPHPQTHTQGTTDPHPKVRWASCQALGQLCTDLGPELQEEQHAKVLPAVMGLMDDFQNPRVQAHACAAVVNFAGAWV